MSRSLSIAEIYHEETKYSAEGLAKRSHKLDFGQQPKPYKDVVTAKRIPLAGYLPFLRQGGAGARMDGPLRDEETAFGLAHISRLLYHTNGTTMVARAPDGKKHYFRAAPSAGALYPTEIYLATRLLPGLDDGIYNFQVRDHSLVPMWEGDFWEKWVRFSYGHEAIARSSALLILSGVFQRSAWRYEERAYRRILLDTGHILGNLLLYAPREGVAARPVGGFFDAALNSLLFFDESEENVLVLAPLLGTGALASDGEQTGKLFASPPRERPEPQGGVMMRLHAASRIDGPTEPRRGQPPSPQHLQERHATRSRFPLPAAPADWLDRLPEVIRRRRSTRAYSANAFALRTLAGILEFGYLPTQPPLDAGATACGPLFDPLSIETYVIVLLVRDIPPGVYFYAPASRELRLLRRGQFRRACWHFCLGQELGRDAAAIVVHTSDLPRAVDAYGDRAYRYLHLDAGHIGQRMNLAALALGQGASGIGGFFDDDISELLGLPPEHVVVYVTTLGVPSRSG